MKARGSKAISAAAAKKQGEKATAATRQASYKKTGLAVMNGQTARRKTKSMGSTA